LDLGIGQIFFFLHPTKTATIPVFIQQVLRTDHAGRMEKKSGMCFSRGTQFEMACSIQPPLTMRSE